ncbi:MAG TPA: GNAT family N-acetyltransferase [Chryseosolibacter sp.]
MATISIRPSRLEEVSVLVNFQQRLALETENVQLDFATVEQGIRAMFADPTKGMYFIAEVDGEVAGCHSITYEWSDWRNGMVWWLQSVYISEKFRKHGVFKAMFENLKRLIGNDPKLAGLRLYVDKSNLRAQHVYQAMGMNGEHYRVFELMK